MPEDHHLFEQLKNRNETAFLTLYKTHKTELTSWIKNRFGLSGEESLEIFQHTMVTFYENVINNRITMLTSSLKTYLFSIGKYKALEVLRKKSRTQPMESLVVLGGETEDLPFEEPETIDDEERRYHIMGTSLKELGSPCSDILTGFYFYRLSLRELKDKLNYKSEESIKSQKFKCMERLRKIYFRHYNTAG